MCSKHSHISDVCAVSILVFNVFAVNILIFDTCAVSVNILFEICAVNISSASILMFLFFREHSHI